MNIINKLGMGLLTTGVMLGMLAASSSAEAVTLSPVQDADIKEATPGVSNPGGTLQMKNSTSGFSRKAYIEFDLSSITLANIASAHLMLPFIAGSAGTDAGIWNFNVYAFDSSGGDAWMDSTLDWDLAPAHSGTNAVVAPGALAMDDSAFSLVGDGAGSTEVLNVKTTLTSLGSSKVTFVIQRLTSNIDLGNELIHQIGDGTAELVITEVPEPSTYAMMGSFLFAAGLAARRRKLA